MAQEQSNTGKDLLKFPRLQAGRCGFHPAQQTSGSRFAYCVDREVEPREVGHLGFSDFSS